MRLHIAAITVALVLVPAATPAWADTTPPTPTATRPAAAETGPVVLWATMEPVGTRARIFVHAASAAGITKVSASLRLKGSDETYAVDGDAKRSGGTEQNGSWNPSPFELKEGRTYLDVELTDATGAHRTVRAATFTDLPASRFSVEASALSGGYDPYPTSKAFGLSATVRHVRPVGRVTAQLHKWQSDETVGDEIPLSGRLTAQGVTYFEAKDVFKPPVGDYDIVVTAVDDQGDAVQARTGHVIEGIASRIDDLKATPDWYDADHHDVTITGRLVSADNGEPLEGTTVAVSGTENKTTTAADGTFTLKLTAQSTTVQIVSSRRGHQLATKATVTLEPRGIPARFSLTSSAKAAKIGDSVTLSGTLERQTTPGAYAPLADRTVTIRYTDYDSQVTSWDYAKATTDANGRYSVKVTVPGWGRWTAHANSGEFDAPDASIDIKASYRTSVVDFRTTTPRVAARGKATLTGRVVRSHASPALTPVGGGDVSVLFAADGKHWTNQGSVRTTADGRFTTTKTAARDGYWQVRYDGPYSYLPVPKSGVPYAFDEPSTSGRVFVDTAIATRITSFNASPEPVKKGRTLTVKGRITKQTTAWKPATGAKLTIYFKPKGSTKWKAMATTKSDRNGWFTKAFKASADGTWAAAYAGSSTYLGIWSAGDYVDVR